MANTGALKHFADLVSFFFGKPRMGIANITSFPFGKPWLGISDLTDIAEIASLICGKPRSGIADITDIVSIAFGKPWPGIAVIASFAFCKPRQTPPSSDICKQGPTVQEPWGEERHSCSYRSACA